FDFGQGHGIRAGPGAWRLLGCLLRATGTGWLLAVRGMRKRRSGKECHHEGMARRFPKAAATMPAFPLTHSRLTPHPRPDSVTAGAAKSATFVPNDAGKFWQRRRTARLRACAMDR